MDATLNVDAKLQRYENGKNPQAERSPSFPSEPSRFKRSMTDFGMWACGQVGVGLSASCGSRMGWQIGIITYHRVIPNVPGVPKPLHNVTPERFRQQIVGLLDRGFNILPLQDVLASYNNGERLPKNSVVVTFDDGYESVYTNAWPVLREHAVPATVFVNTRYLDSDAPFPFDAWGMKHSSRISPNQFRPLATKQCCELSESGLIEFGAHTHTHEDFRSRPNEFRADLQESVDIVTKKFAPDNVTFAFPYGSPKLGFAGGELEAVARATNVSCALTTEPKLNNCYDDPFTWGRFNVFDWDTTQSLTAKLHGWYGWAPHLKKRIESFICGQ